MATPSRPVLSRPTVRLRELLGRWWRPKTTDGAAFTPAEELDGLKAAGERLRQAREAQGLNLRQLALATRISSPVIEALERGWRDRLPEATYLRTMLPLLEAQLGLPAGCLDGALPSRDPQPADRSRRLVLRFTPGSIDVFTTWQGTWLYAGLCLALLYGVNLQQQQLASAGLLALHPVSPLPPSSPKPKASGAKAQLERDYPNLRPLDLAAKGQALRLLSASPASQVPSETGQLLIRLDQPSAVSLQDSKGLRTNLQAGKGELVLPLTSPFRLNIDPPPKGAFAVEWNGALLAPLKGKPNQFVLPRP
jgi:transcriptional regulator with XRE-family HTH domain